MYRNYFKKTLTTEELKKVNAYNPKELKYCNGICQDLLPFESFSITERSKKQLCKCCRNKLGFAQKAIKNGKITQKDFIDNPHILDKPEENTLQTKQCKTCKEFKSVLNFSKCQAVCKACKQLDITKKNSNIEKEIEDVNLLCHNSNLLQNYIVNISKCKLVYLISHFKVGRKSTDIKDKMIENFIKHFEKIQNPLLCSGGCGFLMKEEFETCQDCVKKKEKKQSLLGIRNEVFDEIIDDVLSELKYPILSHEYNKQQLLKIARKLGLSPAQARQLDKKEVVLKTLNTFLENKEKTEKETHKKELQNALGETKEYEIMLNGVNVLAREDGFINATAMCKAGGKKFNEWKRLENTKELINELENESGTPASLLISIKKGNSGKFKQGSWIHPDLAVQLAQWISPTFALKVSRWVREIAITSTVSGDEKSNEQLVILQNTVKEQQKLIKDQESKHNLLLYKRQHYKFKKGKIFYIISDGDTENLKYKVGIDNVDINVRLQQHRTILPNLKLHYLVYTDSNEMLEDTILNRHKSFRKEFLNHEWLYNLDLSIIKQSCKTYLEFVSADYTVETDIEKYNV